MTAALEDAARRWPEEQTAGSRLVLRLAKEGSRTAEDDGRARDEEWRRIVRATAGSMTGTYEPGYLQKLREDWPE